MNSDDAGPAGPGENPPTEAPDPDIPPVEPNVTISGATGTCLSTTEPDHVVVKRRGAVIWRIKNTCTHGHTVSIDFTAGDPLAPSAREIAVPGGQRRPLPCVVKTTAKDDHYLYQVLVDGNVEDPELEVRGPLLPDKPTPAA